MESWGIGVLEVRAHYSITPFLLRPARRTEKFTTRSNDSIWLESFLVVTHDGITRIP